MPELDRSLRELRDDLRSVITKPDLALVVGRARQRRTRRRMQVGAVAAVVAVAAAVPMLRSLPDEDPRPGRLPTAPPVPYSVDFADAKHGYAFRHHCDEESTRCTSGLRVTDDGGRSWEPVELPAGSDQYTLGHLKVFDADHLYYTRNGLRGTGDDTVGDSPGGFGSFVSDDGGRTWRDLSSRPAAPRPIPAGGLLRRTCVDTTAIDSCGSGLGVLTADGVTSPVLTQPPLTELYPGNVATSGGRYWVMGRDPVSGGWAIAVSSDAGVTWSTSPLNLPGEPWPAEIWSVVERDGELFLMVKGMIGVQPLGLLGLFRSTDGGVSWTSTRTVRRTNDLQAVAGDLVATADGRLLVYSTVEGTQVSVDDGRTFTDFDRQLIGPVTWTRGGYVAAGPDNTFEISTDGLDWRRFELS